MDMFKSNLLVNGESVTMSMPFSKVDTKKRLVSGWATADNADTQNDVVLASASIDAFTRARGNIREMHQPIAVGKMINFVEKELFIDNKVHKGIFVTVRVSEGAEDTWKKVLDGTLTGFSIGGAVTDSHTEFSKSDNKTLRVITGYDLTELSLVDNPANQSSNIMSIEKNNGSVTIKGMAVETIVENVFICDSHDEPVVVVSDNELEKCPTCDSRMDNAGWFESDSHRDDKVEAIVTKFIETSKPNLEGGVDVGQKNKDVVEQPKEVETDSAVDPDEVVETEEVVDEAVEEEEAAEEEPVEDNSDEVLAKIDELKDIVSKSVDGNEAVVKRVEELEAKFDESTTKFFERAEELEKRISDSSKAIEAHKNRLDDLSKAVTSLNDSAAFSKSRGHETLNEDVQDRGFWGGAFS